MRLLLPTTLFITSVLASGATITAAISKIANATASLQDAVISWDGEVLGVLPIVVASTTLLEDITAGISVAEASANLTNAEVIGVAGLTQALVADVGTALSAVTAKKEEFAKVFIAPVIKADLELEKSAADEFSAAVLSKVPSTLLALAASIVAPIDVSFDYAIGNFTGLL